eukprot:2806454-Amphidinium_carterae.1
MHAIETFQLRHLLKGFAKLAHRELSMSTLLKIEEKRKATFRVYSAIPRVEPLRGVPAELSEIGIEKKLSTVLCNCDTSSRAQN